MAFVILSAGNLAASRVRTITVRGTAVAVGALLAVTLAGGMAGGVALGYRLAASGADEVPGAPAAASATLDPARPVNQALIKRIGTLSARLLRLESEAVTLATRVGVMDSAEPRSRTGAKGAVTATAPATDPSGGPLLAPVDDALVEVQPDLRADLARLERGLDDVDESLALVSRRAAISDLASMAYPSRYPIPGARISSGFGNRRDPFTKRRARHAGVDMPAPRGTPILASAGGRVRYAGFRRAYGNSVEIDHGAGLVTRYAHASKLLVRRGQVVLPEQPIATVGSTGRSTGPHLHFEVIQNGVLVQPLRYLERPDR